MKHLLLCCFVFMICTSFQNKEVNVRKLSLTAVLDQRDLSTISLKLTLTNNSSDTVKYLTWSCSWQDSYLIDNDRWKFPISFCFKNELITVSLPPYKSHITSLNLHRVIGLTKSKNSNFKIGFHFIPPPESLKIIPTKYEKPIVNDSIIWSNIVRPGYSLKN